jgi:hypothetical protein
MSDTWVRLVPKNKEYIPNSLDQAKAIAHFWQAISDCEGVESESFNTLQFFDAGASGNAYCPNCGEALDNDDWNTWLEEDEDVTQGFKFEMKTLPCCGQAYTLGDLEYDLEQGFGRFCLEALVTAPLTINQVTELEEILGCPLRVIYQHL